MKTLWEKDKFLINCIFSFSHNVFKSCPFQGRYKFGLYGKELSNFSFSHSVFKILTLHTRKNQGLFGKGLMNRGKYWI